jgi:hypothetical protein
MALSEPNTPESLPIAVRLAETMTLRDMILLLLEVVETLDEVTRR